jgi:hypothetical protein
MPGIFFKLKCILFNPTNKNLFQHVIKVKMINKIACCYTDSLRASKSKIVMAKVMMPVALLLHK